MDKITRESETKLRATLTKALYLHIPGISLTAANEEADEYIGHLIEKYDL